MIRKFFLSPGIIRHVLLTTPFPNTPFSTFSGQITSALVVEKDFTGKSTLQIALQPSSQMNDLPYEHQPLPQGDFIRILHVDTSANDRQPVCTFETIPLNARSHRYTAISYTWGDSTPVRHIICSDGQVLGMSKTLSSLFDALSKREKFFTIFVDALCINQNNPEEKAHQVRLMGSVYSKAHRVIVWLGEGDVQTQKLFQYMREGNLQDSLLNMDNWQSNEDQPAADIALPASPELLHESRAVVDALMVLLRRRWFQRVWVLQEAILGANVLVACGDDTIEFDTFKSSILLLWDCDESVDFFDIRHPSYLGFRCATRLFALKEEFHQAGRIPLEPLFEVIFYYSATDSRDFVFAIQGIVKSVKLLPSPDYTASIDKIFTETAENILCKGPSLDLLSMCGLGPRKQASDFLEYCGQPPNEFTDQLPSWVPDFRHPAYNEPMLVCNKGGWNAGGPLRHPPSRSVEGLQVDVIILDEVVRVGSEIDTMEFEGMRGSLHDALNIANNGLGALPSHQIPDTVWKTLLMDLDMNEDPALAEHGLAFKDLVQALDSGQSWEDVKRNEFYRIIRVRTDSWSTFASSRGYFGVTWPLVEERDYICLLPGCRFPLIIRPVDGESLCPSKWTRGSVIGWCYIHGIMHGEAIQEEQEVNRIVLV